MDEPLHYNDEILLKYLDGEMDQTERSLFEDQIKKDAGLQERLQKLQLAIKAVRQHGTVQKVRSIHSEMMQELSAGRRAKVAPMRKIIRYSLGVAATIAIVLIGINLFSTGNFTSEKLYDEAFVEFPISTVRNNQQLTSIETLYQQNNYEEVIAEAKKQQNLSDTARLLTGLSYLKLDQPAEAINWFQSLQQSRLAEDAQFYLSMAYLKNKNYNEASDLMEKIRSTNGHAYQEQFSADYINKVKKLRSK